MKYFNKERWEFIKVLWQEYANKWLSKRIACDKKPVEPRFAERVVSAAGIEPSVVMDEGRWSEFWSWRRVAEDERARTYDERMEGRQRELKI